MEIELIIGANQVTFNGVYLCLAVSGYFQVNFFKTDDRVFRLNELAVEVILVHDSEEYVNSKVTKFASELNLIVPEAAVIALERTDHDLSKEGDFGQHDISSAVLLAVGTQTFDRVS